MKSSVRNIALTFLGLLFLGYACTITNRGWDIHWSESKMDRKSSQLSSLSLNRPTEDRPNVILIMADDLGKYEVSSYGAEDIETPNIDQLAEEGVRFENAYATAPICAPSRASILTGRYQQRYGFETQPMEFYPKYMFTYKAALKSKKRLGDWNLVTDPSYPKKSEIPKQGIPLGEANLAEIMGAAGYSTGIIGKWHLGYGEEQIPINRGFDYQYGFYGAFSLYTPTQKSTGFKNFIQDDLSARHQWEQKREKTSAIRENDQEVIEEDYLTFAIRDKTIDYLEDHKDSSFFLYVPFSAPHVPFQAPDNYYDQFSHIEDENRRIYLAMIKALDDAVGDIMKAVKDLGLEENTIIYFISDNGGASYTGATDNGPLKGGKITHFEGGINVPFIMKWKDKIPGGEVYQHSVSAMDIFTTTITNCGVDWDLSSSDGVDLVPFVNNQVEDKPHEILYWRTDHIRAIRSDNWKMILSMRDNWIHLYDLENDKSEKYDLSAQEEELVKDLFIRLEAWNISLPQIPLWPRLMDRKFVIEGKDYLFPA